MDRRCAGTAAGTAGAAFGAGRRLDPEPDHRAGNWDIHRFANVGDYASYCRMVKSERVSNDKRKGQGNRKCGNKYLAWAWIEAAHFALRHSPPIRHWYDRKCSRRHKIVAIKVVAHKLARAGYYLLRDGGVFDVKRAFG